MAQRPSMARAHHVRRRGVVRGERLEVRKRAGDQDKRHINSEQVEMLLQHCAPQRSAVQLEDALLVLRHTSTPASSGNWHWCEQRQQQDAVARDMQLSCRLHYEAREACAHHGGCEHACEFCVRLSCHAGHQCTIGRA